MKTKPPRAGGAFWGHLANAATAALVVILSTILTTCAQAFMAAGN